LKWQQPGGGRGQESQLSLALLAATWSRTESPSKNSNSQDLGQSEAQVNLTSWQLSQGYSCPKETKWQQHRHKHRHQWAFEELQSLVGSLLWLPPPPTYRSSEFWQV
ncbi:hypothetical protein A6R68_20617, partial [Neotoma lepida]